MATILNIETATAVCSVSLAKNGEVISIRESHTKNSHAEQITLFCEAVVKEAGIQFADLDAVAVSMGPGSYTGLRIGVSTAKGYCFALDKPMIAIPTLQAMAAGMSQIVYEPGALFSPMIDARRMEVYAAVFKKNLKEVEPTTAVVVEENSFGELLENNLVYFGGDGAAKCKDVLDSKNARFMDDFFPSSRFMAALSEARYQAKNFEDVAYFEPYYLKDFVAGIPRVKGLR